MSLTTTVRSRHGVAAPQPLSASTSRASAKLRTSCCARRRRGPSKRWSGYVRPCQQTPSVEVDERLYAADADELLAHVRRLPATVRCVLLIGHNPGIGDLAVMLAGHGDRAARAAMAAKFPTAALARLAIDRRWSAVEAGAATLDEFWTPR